MGNRAVVETQAFFRLAEMTSDDIGKVINVYRHAFLERIEIIQSNEPRGHVPLMIFCFLIGFIDIGFWFVIGAKEADVGFWICIAYGLIGKNRRAWWASIAQAISSST